MKELKEVLHLQKLMAKAKEQSGLGTAEEFEARMRWLSFLKENRIGPVRGKPRSPALLAVCQTFGAVGDVLCV